MPAKIIRDPLYNYISINLAEDGWLVDLIDCPEVQRLRRIHQLGVSDITYPGASHTRFAHTLGVLHLMQRMLEHLERESSDRQIQSAKQRLLAAAVLHDVGHGPFSHLFEPCLEIEHEEWSVRTIRDEGTQVHRVLAQQDRYLPEAVADLIEKDNYKPPQWQKLLLASQLDVDRMDYLRRDSLFTGGGYGHFDWYRLINTLEFYNEDNHRDIVWPDKAKFAIEEFIFARYYMYQNVFLHKTTRGFEQLLQAMWRRAKELRRSSTNVSLVTAIQQFWETSDPTVEKYLRIEEFTVLQQIQQWRDHNDQVLSDLARRFLDREHLAMVEPPELACDLGDGYAEWEEALREKVKHAGFSEPGYYCLCDQLKGKYNQPYFPEKETGDQSAKNTIRVRPDDNSKPIEVSQLLERLRPITTESQDRYRYYVPKEVRAEAQKLRDEWPRR